MLKLLLQHPWDLTTAEAKEVQERLSRYFIGQEQFTEEIKLVAGVDTGFENKFATIRSAMAILYFSELEVVEIKVVHRPSTSLCAGICILPVTTGDCRCPRRNRRLSRSTSL